MDIIISNQSIVPLYSQIMEQIKQLIITGVLNQGEMIPSIRGLAKELKVSIITVKRAYEELEADGFIETLPGKGTFVAIVNLEILREAKISEIEEKLSEVIESAKNIGLSKKELKERIDLMYEEEM
ncbi:GntR family transcriptional regulator [Niameybacter massiliensis]|uniref:GntR family transcriptional regulator n=1 Tax=Holtiella tumoricola TaxID=3018743 RepID=A0AA42DL89_9FIRM|nr:MULTISPECIES: GntR family transcriptional regulator [Lachnospirales]MDA3731107.1 GntR family transcriptional regulator [Holtiella tumoricola]